MSQHRATRRSRVVGRPPRRLLGVLVVALVVAGTTWFSGASFTSASFAGVSVNAAADYHPPKVTLHDPAAVVNGTDSAETLRIDIGDAGSVGTATIRVPANTVISLGSDETEPLLIEDLGGAMPGTDIPMSFQSGDGETTVVPVPVLDGEQDYLAPLVP